MLDNNFIRFYEWLTTYLVDFIQPNLFLGILLQKQSPPYYPHTFFKIRRFRVTLPTDCRKAVFSNELYIHRPRSYTRRVFVSKWKHLYLVSEYYLARCSYRNKFFILTLWQKGTIKKKWMQCAHSKKEGKKEANICHLNYIIQNILFRKCWVVCTNQ